MRPLRALLQLAGQLDPLRLAAGQRRRRLPEAHVAQADVDQRAQVTRDRGDRREELGGLLDRHVQHVRDRLALVVHLEGLPVVPGAVAHLARDVDVGQEVHLDLDRAVAGAGLAAPTLDVEREPARLVAAHLRLGGGGEELADLVPHARVRGGVAPRGAADRALVDPHQLVQVVQAGDPGVPPRHLPRAVEPVRQHRREDVVDQRGLARPGHTGDRHEAAERDVDVHARAGCARARRRSRASAWGRPAGAAPARGSTAGPTGRRPSATCRAPPARRRCRCAPPGRRAHPRPARCRPPSRRRGWCLRRARRR